MLERLCSKWELSNSFPKRDTNKTKGEKVVLLLTLIYSKTENNRVFQKCFGSRSLVVAIRIKGQSNDTQRIDGNL